MRLHGPDDPVYTISVAARLLGVNPQTLRVFERCGLVNPFRTEKNIRLYSENDLILLRRICQLTREERINLAGVKVILRLEGFFAEESASSCPGVSSGRRAGGRRIPVQVVEDDEVEEASSYEEVPMHGQSRGHRSRDH